VILSDEQWEKLEPLLLGRVGRPATQGCDNKLFVEAVLWYVGKRRWRSLPPEFGKWNTTYMRFRRWNMNGVWHDLKEQVKDDPELRGLFEKIVAHADNALSRAKQKAAMKNVRRAYSWPVWKGDEDAASRAERAAASTDWPRLAMGVIRQRLNGK
jgi:transposase